MTSRIKLILLSIVGIGLFSAFQVVDTAGIFSRFKAEEYYKERIAKFYGIEQRKCQQIAIDAAMVKVDSILTGTDRLIDVDSFLLLARPSKPEKPEFDFEKDSLKVNPIFRKDS